MAACTGRWISPSGSVYIPGTAGKKAAVRIPRHGREARETAAFAEPGEDEALELEQALLFLKEKTETGGRPVCTIAFFVPDERKSGGSIATVTEAVRRIDPVRRKIILAKKNSSAGAYEEIDMDRLIRISCE